MRFMKIHVFSEEKNEENVEYQIMKNNLEDNLL